MFHRLLIALVMLRAHHHDAPAVSGQSSGLEFANAKEGVGVEEIKEAATEKEVDCHANKKPRGQDAVLESLPRCVQ